MGVYVFDRKVLTSRLAQICSAGGTDFARDVLPALLPGRRVNGYVFNGYWRDVGTIQAYWEANRDILKPNSGLALQRWEVRTNLFEKGQAGDRPSAYVGRCARVARSLLCRGDHIEGTVIDSILSPGVRVEPGAVIRSAVLLHDCIIGRGSAVELSIIDKNVRVGARCRIGVGTDLTVNREFPKHLFTGITLIGKNAVIPEGARIGRNCLVFPGVGPDELRKGIMASGETIRK
jgi:glucose-1-phosphate adenylyltransferase